MSAVKSWRTLRIILSSWVTERGDDDGVAGLVLRLAVRLGEEEGKRDMGVL